MGALDQLEPIETASKDALDALQLERLKKTLHTAYDRVANTVIERYGPTQVPFELAG